MGERAMNPKSRAHRSFRGIPRFKFLDENQAELVAGRFSLPPEDELPFGIYEESTQTILMSRSSLYVKRGGSELVRIPFDSMTKTVGPATKETTQIEIHTRDGQVQLLNISGGHGRFKDVFSFKHFLMRVLEDCNRR